MTTAVLVLVFGWLLTQLVADDLVASGQDALAELTDEMDGISLVELGEEGAEFRIEQENTFAVAELDDDGDVFVELFRDAEDDPDDEFADDDGEPFGAFVIDTGTEDIRAIENFDGSMTDTELRRVSEQVAAEILDGEADRSSRLDLVRSTQDVLEGVSDGVTAARQAAWRIGPLLVLLSAGVTWFVVGRALAPTRRIAREASEIDTDRLERRLTRRGDGAEVDAIAGVVNDMLDRIEAGVRREQQFVADASHELRTPLATTRLAAELAGADAPESPYPRQMVEEIDRMQALVDDLLELARGAAGRRGEPLALDRIVADAVSSHPAAARITASIADGLEVIGRRAELRRVVVNLLDNADRFADHQVSVTLDGTTDRVVLTVDDDGPGIPPGDRDRVFDRFTRLDEGRARDAGGSGLGLAIVRSIVAGHGGTVSVGDGVDGGARLVVDLPRS
ncbi:MAG: HAMP domain-containing sensor histidine kinase [Actinomycetota bacterium]